MGRAILIIGAGALLVGIWVYGLVDAARADKAAVRTLPKAAWLLITFLIPVIGCLLWLAFGRPRVARLGMGGTAPSGFRAPDDDEDFLRFLEQKERRMRESREKDEGKEPQDDEE